MKGQLTIPEQRGIFLIMHSHAYEQGRGSNGQHVIKRVLKIAPGVGTEVIARDGKRGYLVGPRGNLIRKPNTLKVYGTPLTAEHLYEAQ